MTLDKLRALDKAARSGPRTSRRVDTLSKREGTFKLAALSKLLLPMAEALDEEDCFYGFERDCGNDDCLRCAVLAQLDKALK